MSLDSTFCVISQQPSLGFWFWLMLHVDHNICKISYVVDCCQQSALSCRKWGFRKSKTPNFQAPWCFSTTTEPIVILTSPLNQPWCMHKGMVFLYLQYCHYWFQNRFLKNSIISLRDIHAPIHHHCVTKSVFDDEKQASIANLTLIALLLVV